MNIQLTAPMTKTAFLDWVQGRDQRYELDRGRLVMMTGGSRAHWQITANLFKALDARIDLEKWSVLPEFGVDVNAETIRYPDIVIDRAGEGAKDLTATAPVLIAEVLSPGSERVDLGDKAAEFLPLQTLRAYLVLAQDERKVWSWVRMPEGFAPGPAVTTGEEAAIRIEPLGIALPFAEIYARVALQ